MQLNCHVQTCLVCEVKPWLLLLTLLELTVKIYIKKDKWLASCKQHGSVHQAPHHDKDKA